MKTNSQKTLITIAAFGAFFLFGFLDNLKGPTIPFIIKDLNINYSLIGNILFIQYVGFFTATIVAGMLSFRYGLKNTLLAALFLLFIGLFLTSSMPFYWILLLSYLALGLGMGTVEIAGNSTIVLLHQEKKGMLLNLLGSLHGLGAMLVPVYAGALLSNHVSWRIVFAICLIPVFVLIIYLLWVKFPKQETEKGQSLLELARTAFSPEMIWHYIAICFYVAVEIGVAAWIVEYLNKVKGQPLFFSSVSLSIYFGLVTGGRFLGGFIVDRVGHLRILFWVITGSLISLIIGIYGSNNLAFFIPLTGLFFSIIFPTLTASFTNIQKPEIEKYLGILFTFAGIGGMIGPWLIGLFGDLIQLSNSIAILIVYTVIMLVAIIFLLLMKKSESPTISKTN